MTRYSFPWRGGLLLAVLACAGCQDQHDAKALATAQGIPSAALASQQVDCAASSQVCVRVREEHGAACLKMTETSTPAQRAAMRDCALRDFTAARAQMPSDAPPDMRLRAAAGLAEALVIDRDDAMDTGRRTSDATQLDALAGELQTMPGGAAYGAYFAANATLNRVLTGGVPADRACSMLAAANSDLRGAQASGELAQRIEALRAQIDTAKRPPLRSCA